jgi:uncharacterized protein (DUF1697 family)
VAKIKADAQTGRYAALLRAVNLPGHNKISMAALKELCESLQFADVRTLLQSGNVVFSAQLRPNTELETLLEKEAEKRFGLVTNFFVRRGSEFQAMVNENPFPREAERDPSHLVLLFLRNEPTAEAVDALQESIVGRELVRAVGRHAYVVYPDGIGTSRLSMAMIEKKLGRCTGRNWNTVLKLRDLTKS